MIRKITVSLVFGLALLVLLADFMQRKRLSRLLEENRDLMAAAKRFDAVDADSTAGSLPRHRFVESPDAAFESYLWALQNDDLNLWLNLKTTPEMRTGWESSADTLGHNFQQEAAVLKSIGQLNIEQVERHGNGQVLIYATSPNASGRIWSFQLKEINKNWKILVTGIPTRN